MDAYDAAWLSRLSLFALRIMRDRRRLATLPRDMYALAGHMQRLVMIEDEITRRESKNDARAVCQEPTAPDTLRRKAISATMAGERR